MACSNYTTREVCGWIVLALSLMFISFTVGYKLNDHKQSPVKHQQHICMERRDTLSEWQILQLAMIKTESDFNPLAVGKNKDIGILQLTPILIKDVNRILGQEKYIHEDAFSPERSLEMFSIVQDNYNSDQDIIKAITIHNPGGESIGYSKRVLQSIEWIQRYEYIRALVIQGD